MIWLKFNLPILILIQLFFSCAQVERKMGGGNAKSRLFSGQTESFTLTDKSGQFELARESGRSDNNRFLVKQQIKTTGSQVKVAEQSVTLSQIGRLKNSIDVMRPEQSQYSVWFDGDRFFSEVKIDVASKSAIVTLVSPEAEWNGQQTIAFPDDGAVYCFYAQLIECAFITGFIDKAIEKKAGSMNFYILWEGYPYIMQQYVEIPEELFTRAVLEYDGLDEENQNRFSLRFAGQSIFYFINSHGRYDRHFWVSQGLSVVKRGRTDEGR